MRILAEVIGEACSQIDAGFGQQARCVVSSIQALAIGLAGAEFLALLNQRLDLSWINVFVNALGISFGL